MCQYFLPIFSYPSEDRGAIYRDPIKSCPVRALPFAAVPLLPSRLSGAARRNVAARDGLEPFQHFTRQLFRNSEQILEFIRFIK